MTQSQLTEVTAPHAGVETLLARHHAAMRAGSPEESCHVMTGDELRASGARIFALEKEGEVAAIGAFKVLDDPTAIELKSMHTAQEFRGQGLGGIVLQGLLQEAIRAGAQSAWLETGSDDGFAPARALYERAGFVYCAPFGSYTTDPLSVFMTMEFGLQHTSGSA